MVVRIDEKLKSCSLIFNVWEHSRQTGQNCFLKWRSLSLSLTENVHHLKKPISSSVLGVVLHEFGSNDQVCNNLVDREIGLIDFFDGTRGTEIVFAETGVCSTKKSAGFARFGCFLPRLPNSARQLDVSGQEEHERGPDCKDFISEVGRTRK